MKVSLKIKVLKFILILFCITNYNLFANDCDFSLKLTTNKKTVNQGDFIVLNLILKSNQFIDLNKAITKDLNGIYQGNNMLDFKSVNEASGFEQQIVIDAVNVGTFEIKPYTIKIDDCEITSNSLEITVLEKKEQPKVKKVINFSVNKIKMEVGETKEIELNANFRLVELLEFKSSGFTAKKSGSQSHNVDIHLGILSEKYKVGLTIHAY